MKVIKNSSIKSVGEIPSHWIEKGLKFCLKSGSEGIKIGPFGSALKSEMLVDKGFKVYGQENLIKNDFSLGQRFIDEKKFEELMVYEINPGDILISMMGTIGKCKVVPKGIERGIMDSHLIRLSFDKSIIIPEFVAFLIQESFYIKTQLDLQSKGSIMSGLNSSIIKNLKLILPPLAEQTILLEFIDSKFSRIDYLIDTKQKLINLLEEKRQSIITEAVTKGINPNVKMKDSGVEWIGEIPEHWNVKKIKYKFEIKKIIEPREELTVLSLTQKGLKIKNLTDFSGQHAKSYDKYQRVEINDYVMNGMDLLTGYVDCSKFKGVTSPDYRVFRIRNNAECREYYLRYFQMCYSSKIFYGHGQGVSNFGRWRLQTDAFKEFPIPEPPIEEQYKIYEFIDKQEKEIKKLIEITQKQINQLKEYRQSLIYEAVTGKIDVHELVAEK